MTWENTQQRASFARPMDSSGRVECTLCPRHCKPSEGKTGFCKVRRVEQGHLHTLNFGRSVAATEEVIETEAVNHYAPGARILSLGNVGCMMSCSFCQNWETSQVKRLHQKSVHHYTPEQIIDICLTHHIPIISWTYNDPVVWHEFVVETSRLAQQHGIKCLYKSAFYIEEKPVEELLDCIDIFSLSLKSMNDAFYRRVCKATLQPVLDRIKQVHASGKHLELSQLVIPELNDADEDLCQTIDWIGNHIGIQVPLHFVAFHPAYKYTHVERTAPATLKHARTMALQAGFKNCYLGNLYEDGANNTHCEHCSAILVERYGLHASLINLKDDGTCKQCGQQSTIKEAGLHQSFNTSKLSGTSSSTYFQWHDDINSAHIHRLDGSRSLITIGVEHGQQHYQRQLGAGLDRIIISKQSDNDIGFIIHHDASTQLQVLPVLDRAHFPVSTNPNDAVFNNTNTNRSHAHASLPA